MKQRDLSFLLAMLLSIVVFRAFAYDMKVDGIYYILDSSNKTATVTSNPSNYSGDIVIPQTVSSPNGTLFRVTSIGVKAFERCRSLTSIVIPEGVTSIGRYAFMSCGGLKSVTIPSSMKYIDVGAFSYSALTSVTIMSNSTSILDYVFQDCLNLRTVTIPENVKPTSNDFEGVTSIGPGAFMSCKQLVSIDIPSNVSKIGGDAFNTCSSLTTIAIPKGVTSFGTCIFANCSNLSTVYLKGNVTGIGVNTFYGCNKLTDLYCYAKIVPSTHNTSFNNASITKAILHVPATSIDAYKTTNPWSSFKNIVALPDNLDEDLQSEAYAILSSDKTTLSFFCDGQKNNRRGIVYSADNFRTKDNESWGEYKSLITTVIFDDTFADFEGSTDYWFESCSNLKTIQGLQKIRKARIGDYMFSYCSGLDNIDFLNSVTDIGSWAFYGCSSLTSIYISSSVTNIGEGAFSGCNGIVSIAVDPNNKKFDSRDNCNAIIYSASNCLVVGCKNSVIPNSVTNIGICAFYDCSLLSAVFIPNSVTTVGTLAFSGCYGLTNVIIPNSVIYIQDFAFRGCRNLTSVTIPNSVISIDSWAFDGCERLVDVYCYAEEIPTTSNSAFNVSYISEATLHVPLSAIDAYRATSPWSGFGSIVPIEEVTEKEAYAVLTDDGTLTFYYDNQKGKRSGTSYELNTGTNKPGWYDNRANITKAVFDASFADARPTTTYCWFREGENMKSIEGIKNLNTSNVTSMEYMFAGCSGLTSLDLSDFNTSNVTNMRLMFWGCSGLTSLDLSSFNTSNVTNMGGMFDGCSGLTSLDLRSFNTSNVTGMYSIFGSCSGLTSLDLSNFNTSNVTDMSGMFYGCSSLTSLDVSSFNTSKVANMNSMFSGCSGLTSLGLSNFDTSNVTDMYGMFSGCRSLTNIDLCNFNTNNVTSMSSMFNSCRSLTSLDLSSFDTSNVKYMSSMFYNCSGLKTIICGDEWSIDNVTSSKTMFDGCTKLVGGDGTVYDANYTDASKAYAGIGGYLTMKGADGDDLQRYLDSLIDTEDEFVNNVYRRVFLNDDWQALYVPFEMNYSDWADKFEVASIYGFYWYDDDDNNYVDRQELVATKVESGSLQANFPYLIRAKAKTGATLTVNVTGNVSQQITVASMELPSVTYYFTGNYSQLTGLMSGLCYRLQGGSLFIPLSDSEVLQPYRWYMTMDAASPQSVRLNIITDGETTAIEKVNKSELIIHNSQLRPQVYDLRGRRVDADAKSLPKGVYIINNMKCVIK